MGAINNVLTFNANIIKIYEHGFFPKRSYESSYSIHLLANLDLGIETSYFDGMYPCSKTLLQFSFQAMFGSYILILIVISLRYSSKVVRLLGSHLVPVLATILFLSYIKLISNVFQTIISLIFSIMETKYHIIDVVN